MAAFICANVIMVLMFAGFIVVYAWHKYRY